MNFFLVLFLNVWFHMNVQPTNYLKHLGFEKYYVGKNVYLWLQCWEAAAFGRHPLTDHGGEYRLHGKSSHHLRKMVISQSIELKCCMGFIRQFYSQDIMCGSWGLNDFEIEKIEIDRSHRSEIGIFRVVLAG